jgi:dTDP-4-amino-4,6-dideoxy-D-galactose acyltransferase
VVRRTHGKRAQIPALLPWDTEHFGFPVARVTETDLDDTSLSEALRAAARKGVRLVYWVSEPGRRVSPLVLGEFSGTLVDHKATFVARLPETCPSDGDSQPATARVSVHPRGSTPARLIELALVAGTRSRFRVDPRFPRDRFEHLYETWIRRSVEGEAADAVLVASRPDDPEVVGMVTVSEARGEGQIGLISVLDRVQGLKFGTTLMRAAHRWMIARGASSSRVVTQLDNLAACCLYERSGYRLDGVKDFYHFWPQ